MTETNLKSTAPPGNQQSKRQRLLNHYILQFFGREGDLVHFKNVAKRKRVEWAVIGVETTASKITWTKKGNKPNFVHLRRKDSKQTVWTCSDQLVPAGFSE